MTAANDPKIGLMVLAAGASRRMNRPKQLLPFEGKTLLRWAAEAAAGSVCRPVMVVLGAEFENARGEVEDLPVSICFNENWPEGLSSSIKMGLRQLLKIEPALSAVLITLGDQPLVSSGRLNLFVEKFRQTNRPVVAAVYDGTFGVPALFADRFFADLFRLEGDRGARQIIEQNREFLASISLPEAAFDIDTPADLKRLEEFARGE